MKKVAILSAAVLCILSVAFISGTLPAGSPFATKDGTQEHLGELLFFDPILSATRTISCASCHIPAFGFADTSAVSTGIHGRKGTRNAPSCTNLAERPYFFYDGRAATLPDQIHFPIENKDEMGLPYAEAVARVSASKTYLARFKKVYGAPPNGKNLAQALAAYMTTLETSNTPFDRFMNGDSTAISVSAQRGRELFMSPRAKCFDCHFSPDFTGDEFRNIGLFDGQRLNDSGRFTISKDMNDIGKFKVPGLRNVAVTAPYMHNGMFRTLRQVLNYYNDPFKTVPHPINTDSLLLQPLNLTETEITDLENFLITLSDDRFKKH
jgi:cytochrome c peroxidase